MKVLICDDDPMTLKALEFQLKKDGHSVVKADNGKDAIHILNSDRDVNFLITDLYMPVSSGLELITHVRDELKSQMPVLILTRSNVEETMNYALDLGASGYLTKPFKLEDMKARIESIIKNAGDVSKI
ncbi:MAG: response regulator [Bacteroidales bacterium]|jgi:DNA-binding response OmpR family regulator|nr:response regulator [Bacteroidales bacterium]